MSVTVFIHTFLARREKFTHESQTFPTINLGPAGRRPALGLVLQNIDIDIAIAIDKAILENIDISIDMSVSHDQKGWLPTVKLKEYKIELSNLC